MKQHPSQECSESALQKFFLWRTTGRAPSRALSGALVRAPRSLRALPRALSGALLEVSLFCRKKRKNVYQYQPPPPIFLKGHAMRKKMAGTHEFAFFVVEAYVRGGGSRIRQKKKSKNAFWPVPDQNLLFQVWALYPEDSNFLKSRSLDSSCPTFPSDNSIWGQ